MLLYCVNITVYSDFLWVGINIGILLWNIIIAVFIMHIYLLVSNMNDKIGMLS